MLTKALASVIAFGITCCDAQQNASQASSDLENDVYAIYSLMLTNPRTSHGPDSNPRYLIQDITAPGHPDEPCIRPPAEYQQRFAEVLQEFGQRQNATPRTLKRALSIPKPYVLLKPDDVRRFQTRSQPEMAREPFADVLDLFTLTDVYFNKNRTLALTAISSWCGSLCALYQWEVFEKQASGKWEEKPWAACITIARSRPLVPHAPIPQ